MKLTEKEARDNILAKCKEISTKDEEISFLGWKDGKYINNRTKIILKNSKLGIIWDTSLYDSFIRTGMKRPGKFKEEYNIKLIEQKCKEISTDSEIITFLGWKGGKYIGNNKTKLILYNSKYNCTWDTTLYSSFLSNIIRRPHYFDEKYYITLIKNKCKEISTNDETITFIGWKNGIFKNNRTKLILYNSKYDIIWDTTQLSNFLSKIIRSPYNPLKGVERGPKIKHYKGEDLINENLNKLNIKNTHHYNIKSSNIPGCPNKDYIEVDFYLEHEGRKIFIEFNGRQHYEFIPFMQKEFSNFTRQVQRDSSLREYAKDNGIELLEIPYTDIQRIPEILDAFLERGEDITTKIYRQLP